jgi:hypothetical protein
MILITMHVLLGMLIGAVIVTMVIAGILISTIRSYSRRLDEMDTLIRKLHKDEIESLRE